jgi:hypothetical protein
MRTLSRRNARRQPEPRHRAHRPPQEHRRSRRLAPSIGGLHARDFPSWDLCGRHGRLPDSRDLVTHLRSASARYEAIGSGFHTRWARCWPGWRRRFACRSFLALGRQTDSPSQSWS